MFEQKAAFTEEKWYEKLKSCSEMFCQKDWDQDCSMAGTYSSLDNH